MTLHRLLPDKVKGSYHLERLNVGGKVKTKGCYCIKV